MTAAPVAELPPRFTLTPPPEVLEAPPPLAAPGGEGEGGGGGGEVPDLLEAMAPRGPKKCIRVHRVQESGVRGSLVLTLSIDEQPDVARERIARHGPGEYELVLVEDGRYKGAGRRVMIEGPPAAVAATPVASGESGALSMVRVMIEENRAFMREMVAAQREAAMQDRLASKDSTIEILKASRSGGGGGGGIFSGPIAEAMIPLIIAKFTEDPHDKLLKTLELRKAVREDEPEGKGGDMSGALASVADAFKNMTDLSRIEAQARARQAQRPVTVRPMPPPIPGSVTAAPSPTAAPPPTPAPGGFIGVLQPMLPGLVNMASKGMDTDLAAMAVVGMLPEDMLDLFSQAVANPMLPQLLVSQAPALAPHLEWLAQLREATVKFFASSGPEAPVEGGAT